MLPARRTNAERCGDGTRCETTDLDVRRESDPAVLAALRRLGSPLFEACVFRQLEGNLKRLVVVTRVVREARCRCVRELVGLDEVATANLCGIDAEVVRNRIHQPLDPVRCLGATRAAIGVGRRRVGKDLTNRDRDVLNVVTARHHKERQVRDGRRQELVVGPVVLDRIELERKDLAVLVDASLVVLDLVATVDRGDRVFGAILDPLDGTTHDLGGRTDCELLAIRVELGAEATTHVGCDDAHLRFGRAADDADERPHEVCDLRRGVERHLTGRVRPVANATTSLHWHRRHALVDDAQRDLLRRLRQRVGKAVGDVRERLDEIAVVLGVHEGCTGLERLLGIDDDRDRVVINLHGIGRVAGEVAIVGNHHRHGLADVACELLGQNCLLGVANVAARVGGAQHAGLHRQRRVGQYGVDAGHGQGG